MNAKRKRRDERQGLDKKESKIRESEREGEREKKINVKRKREEDRKTKTRKILLGKS